MLRLPGCSAVIIHFKASQCDRTKTDILMLDKYGVTQPNEDIKSEHKEQAGLLR